MQKLHTHSSRVCKLLRPLRIALKPFSQQPAWPLCLQDILPVAGVPLACHKTCREQHWQRVVS
jgi:hypothetical protein